MQNVIAEPKWMMIRVAAAVAAACGPLLRGLSRPRGTSIEYKLHLNPSPPPRYYPPASEREHTDDVYTEYIRVAYPRYSINRRAFGSARLVARGSVCVCLSICGKGFGVWVGGGQTHKAEPEQSQYDNGPKGMGE